MLKARVVGKVWATIRAALLEERKLLLLAPLDAQGRATGRLLVGADAVSCGEGQTVLVTFGSGSRNALQNQETPVEACVVGIIADSCLKASTREKED